MLTQFEKGSTSLHKIHYPLFISISDDDEEWEQMADDLDEDED